MGGGTHAVGIGIDWNRRIVQQPENGVAVPNERLEEIRSKLQTRLQSLQNQVTRRWQRLEEPKKRLLEFRWRFRPDVGRHRRAGFACADHAFRRLRTDLPELLEIGRR